jgi:hypothetical protein
MMWKIRAGHRRYCLALTAVLIEALWHELAKEKNVIFSLLTEPRLLNNFADFNVLNT